MQRISSHDRGNDDEEAQPLTDYCDGLLTTPATTTGVHDFAAAAEKDTAALSQGEDSSDDEGDTDIAAERSLLQPQDQDHIPRTPLARRLSFVEEDEAAPVPHKPDKEDPVTWKSLPKKGQLAILTLARLSEPLTERGLQAYMFYQLKSFDATASDSTIASQAGLLGASFSAAQFLTAFMWGTAADSPRFGRKRVLIIGLFGTLISCMGIGFANSYWQAVIFRTLGGAVNGNVGVMRTMISEIVKEKKFQSRAFLLLPMCFNIGIIIGPVLGGFLAEPTTSFPGVFGEGSVLGGKNGVGWMKSFPYALPNLFSAFVIFIAMMGVLLGLDETHHSLQHKPDWGRAIGKRLCGLFSRKPRHHYTSLHNSRDDLYSPDSIDLETQPNNTSTPKGPIPRASKLPFLQIFTPNVLLTLLIHFLLAMHISAFNSLIFILLPAPRSPSPPPQPHNLLHFTGGLGLPSSRVGIATAIIGVIGFPMQLVLYPRLNYKLGTLRCYRTFLPFSPLAYTLVPYLALLPKNPFIMWPALAIVLGIQVISRTFALPGAIILINNSSPSPAVLGTIHGVAQSVSSAARTIGPLVGGWGLGLGLRKNIVGAVWWAMAVTAITGWAFSFLVYEGDGGGGVSLTVNKKEGNGGRETVGEEEGEEGETDRFIGGDEGDQDQDSERRNRPRI